MKTSTTGKPVEIPYELKDIAPDRHELFLRYYTQAGPSQFNIRRSAIKAGFSSGTASKAGRSVLLTALRREKRQLEAAGAPTIAEKAGLSREVVLEQLREIVMQNKDYRTKLRALERMLGEYGVDVSQQKQVKNQFNNSPVRINIIPPAGYENRITPQIDSGFFHENMAQNIDSSGEAND